MKRPDRPRASLRSACLLHQCLQVFGPVERAVAVLVRGQVGRFRLDARHLHLLRIEPPVAVVVGAPELLRNRCGELLLIKLPGVARVGRLQGLLGQPETARLLAIEDRVSVGIRDLERRMSVWLPRLVSVTSPGLGDSASSS